MLKRFKNKIKKAILIGVILNTIGYYVSLELNVSFKEIYFWEFFVIVLES